MGFLKKKLNVAEGAIYLDGMTEIEKIGEVKEATATVEEEWIWVEGYKGTDKDMKCRDYQYELGKRFDMPDDSTIEECLRGFHMCLHLKDVYNYYTIGNGRRFFKVRALVRKKDYDAYGTYIGHLYGCARSDKLAAKSIEFISECSIDEIFESAPGDLYGSKTYSEWTLEEKKLAIDISLNEGNIEHRANILIKMGYSRPLAYYVAGNNKMFDRAIAIAHENVNMDIKVLFISGAHTVFFDALDCDDYILNKGNIKILKDTNEEDM